MSHYYEITPQRQKYLDARGYTILSACPGSGKTTSIVNKLKVVSRYCEERYGNHTGFLCMSFTNKACEELKQKYCDMHGEGLAYPNEVLTIDSFIIKYVILPFWYLYDLCKKKPLVVNEKKILDQIYYNYIFVGGEWQDCPRKEFSRYARLLHCMSPSLISREMSCYKWKNNKVSKQNEIEYCEAAFAYRLSVGYITSTDALWIACCILQHYRDIARAIVSRFPYIIVDEAQDNSELHFEFFRLLQSVGLQNMEFVGDICQSIYGFNNAKPELLKSLMTKDGWNVLPLSECRRSNQRIINLYSKLKSNDVSAITSHGVEDKGIPIVVYKYDDNHVSDIIHDFYQICDDNELSNRIILARGNSMCKRLAGVKDVNFKYWKSAIPYLLIDALFAYDSSDMECAFRNTRLVLAELISGNNPEAKRKFIQEIEEDVDWNVRIFGFLRQLPNLSLSFKEWSEQTCQLLKDYWKLDEKPDFVAFKQKKGYHMNTMANVPVEQYHQSNDKYSEYHRNIDTIHAVKGASYDAVLLFLSSDSRGQNISLNDFPSISVEDMNESQRMIYVACSRARQFLALAVPKSTNDEKIRNALVGVEIEIRSISL